MSYVGLWPYNHSWCRPSTMIVDYLARSYEQPKWESRHTARLERRLHWSMTAQFKFCIKHTVELSRLTVMSYAGLWAVQSLMAVLSQWLRRVSDKAPAPKRKPSIGRKIT
ncbi:hypothetical protein TsFJ059_000268 [Trichoderma semiorbis]|uniref:Uncharacterized protein n=1 Tax=Trichoderma semiorbis TaxID=1491008 RepID=A0A9P8HUV6_9HYPO|nr:hypothetical protein TsFJ059_000268 [Trichoderma semiorbis]